MHDSKVAIRKVYSGEIVGEFGKGTFLISPNSGMSKEEGEQFVKALIKRGEKPVRVTLSLCPACADENKWLEMRIPALVFEKNSEILIRKKCKKHGVFEEKYWEDSEFYYRARHFADNGLILENPQIAKDPKEVICPLNCGLCAKHKSHTALANIAVTNRCDLSCWYCFFYQRQNQPVYEPSLEQIRKMLRVLRSEKPVPSNAIQLTGGEPSVRKDIVSIVKMCREEGFEHVQFNTNGINFSKNPKLAREVIEAGANVIYLSFDGVSPKTNTKNYYEIPAALENIRKAKNAGVVFVPTVINGVNTGEIGDILRYAAANIDVVRGVNFQPVSMVGMMPKNHREKQRITIPRTLKLIEEQTNGEIEMNDFYPVPCVKPITDLVEAIRAKAQYRLSTHFACGAGTYVFMDGKKFVPITRFIDVEALFEYLEQLAVRLRNSKAKGLSKVVESGKLLYNINSFIDARKQPKGLDLGKLITKALIAGSYDGLKEFHYRSLFVGMMHFQDPYNYDVDRVERCAIHYALPDGRVVPFCAYNVLPNLYRDKTNREFSTPAGEWEEKNKQKLKDDKYVRKLTTEKKLAIDKHYREMIGKFK